MAMTGTISASNKSIVEGETMSIKLNIDKSGNGPVKVNFMKRRKLHEMSTREIMATGCGLFRQY